MLENGSFISMLPELFCCEKVVFSSYETGRRYQEIVSEIRFARGKKKKKKISQWFAVYLKRIWHVVGPKCSEVWPRRFISPGTEGGSGTFLFQTINQAVLQVQSYKESRVWHTVWELNFFSLQKALFVTLNDTYIDGF